MCHTRDARLALTGWPGMGLVDYEPVQCKKAGCGCILNPYCQVEFQQMLWVCPFCLTRNHFPPGYRCAVQGGLGEPPNLSRHAQRDQQ